MPRNQSIVFKQTSSRPLALNVYCPRASGPAPLIVYAFGGAWRVGDRMQVESWMGLTGLTDDGFTVASFDYRLSTEAVFPAQIEDLWDAVRYLVEHAGELDVDPNRIGIIGPSAGGHLAALAGATSGSSRFGALGVQAVVDFYGPTDFLQMDAHSISTRIVHDDADSPESMLVGGAIQSCPELAAAANPITYLTPAAPPFFIVHGDRDPLVPHHQSELLAEALTRHGVAHEFHTVTDGGHGGFESDAWLERVRGFFEATLVGDEQTR